MKKNLLDILFGPSLICTDKLSDVFKLSELLSEENEGETKDEPKKMSYVNTIKKKYKDGELIKKHETEFVNGKCVKDECVCKDDKVCVNDECICGKADKSSLEQKNEETQGVEKETETTLQDILISELNKQTKELQGQVEDLVQCVDNLLEENKRLNKIIDNIKNCF